MNNLNCAYLTNEDFAFDCGKFDYESITKSPKNKRNSSDLEALCVRISKDNKKTKRGFCENPWAIDFPKGEDKNKNKIRQKKNNLGKKVCDNGPLNDIIVKNKKGALQTQIVSENFNENLGKNSFSSPVSKMDSIIAEEWKKFRSGAVCESSEGRHENGFCGEISGGLHDFDENKGLSRAQTESTEICGGQNEGAFAEVDGLSEEKSLEIDRLNEEEPFEDNGEDDFSSALCDLSLFGSSFGEALGKTRERLEEEKEKASKQLESLGVVRVLEGKECVSAIGFNEILLNDRKVAEQLPLQEPKVYKCDLCNMTLSRENAKSWGVSSWVKFFLKSIKSVSYSASYYDRLFDKHVQSSFYSSHIEKFGSIENFFDTMTVIIERKNVMKSLQSFVKRMYKELNELEVLIVDRFVFDADNLDEILERVSYRTMYRKAEKIIPKLADFLLARGYTPEWCMATFGKIM